MRAGERTQPWWQLCPSKHARSTASGLLKVLESECEARCCSVPTHLLEVFTLDHIITWKEQVMHIDSASCFIFVCIRRNNPVVLLRWKDQAAEHGRGPGTPKCVHHPHILWESPHSPFWPFQNQHSKCETNWCTQARAFAKATWSFRAQVQPLTNRIRKAKGNFV